MKSLPTSLALLLSFLIGILASGCSTSEVRNTRTSGVENRQDRIDARSSARQERWKVRGEREDARSRAAFDAM